MVKAGDVSNTTGREREKPDDIKQESLITHDLISLSKNEANCSIRNHFNNYACKRYAFLFENESENEPESFAFVEW